MGAARRRLAGLAPSRRLHVTKPLPARARRRYRCKGRARPATQIGCRPARRRRLAPGVAPLHNLFGPNPVSRGRRPATRARRRPPDSLRADGLGFPAPDLAAAGPNRTLVFWRYATFDQLLGYDYVAMFLLSLLLAFLSWKFVELPFRSSGFWTRRRTFAFASAGITLLVALGTACVAAQGWPASLHPAANAMTCDDPRRPFVAAASRLVLRHAGISLGDAWDSLDIAERRQAFALAATKAAPTSVAPPPPAVFVMGDSHASVFLDGFDVVLGQHGLAAQCAGHTATIMFDLESQVCQDALRKLQQFPAIEKILLLQDWSYQLHQSPTPEVLYQHLEQFALHARGLHKSLYIATDNPVRDFSPADLAARMRIIKPRHPDAKWDGRQSVSDYNRMQGNINQRLAELCRRTGAVLLPLHQALAKDGCFPAFADQHGTLIPLYRDDNHLSFYGSQMAAEFIFPRLFPMNALPAHSPAALAPASP